MQRYIFLNMRSFYILSIDIYEYICYNHADIKIFQFARQRNQEALICCIAETRIEKGAGMRKKLLLTSILSIAMCLSLIAGATFALFGSESKKNIAVTSGKVDVSAEIVSLDTYSCGTATEKDGEFANGGTAEIDADNAGVTVDRMSPGDKIVIKIDVENNSNIAYRQRVKLGFGSGTEDFYGQLLVGVSEDGGEFKYFGNYATGWTYHEANTGGTPEISPMYISVELPEYVSENWQDKGCDITFAVEAIQGNADTEGEESYSRVYQVETQEELQKALDEMQSEETVVLSGGAWEEATISFEDNRTIYVRGYKVGTLTVSAPAGEVHYYNDADEIIGEALAGESLHVYGNVGTVTINRGHAVMEAGASAAKISVVPAANAAAQVDVAAGAEVQSIFVDAAEGTKAEVSVAEGASVPEMTVTGKGEITLGGEVERTIEVWTEEALRGALGVSGTVTLCADIETSDELAFACDAALDLNGHTLTVADGTKAIKTTPGKTLTVQGSGTVYGALYADKLFNNGSTLIVNAGESLSVQSSSPMGWAVYGAFNSKIVLNGGTYSVGNIESNTGVVEFLGTYLEINDATVNVTAKTVLDAYGIHSNAAETYLNDVTVNAKYSRAVYLNNSFGKTVIRGGAFTTDEYTDSFVINPTIDYKGTLDISGATITRVGVGILYSKPGATVVEGLTNSDLTFVSYGDSAAGFKDIDVKK